MWDDRANGWAIAAAIVGGAFAAARPAAAGSRPCRPGTPAYAETAGKALDTLDADIRQAHAERPIFRDASFIRRIFEALSEHLLPHRRRLSADAKSSLALRTWWEYDDCGHAVRHRRARRSRVRCSRRLVVAPGARVADKRTRPVIGWRPALPHSAVRHLRYRETDGWRLRARRRSGASPRAARIRDRRWVADPGLGATTAWLVVSGSSGHYESATSSRLDLGTRSRIGGSGLGAHVGRLRRSPI